MFQKIAYLCINSSLQGECIYIVQIFRSLDYYVCPMYLRRVNILHFHFNINALHTKTNYVPWALPGRDRDAQNICTYICTNIEQCYADVSIVLFTIVCLD